MPIIEHLDTPAVAALKQAGMSFSIFQHQQKIHSLEQAAEERGQRSDQIVRSILFRLNPETFVLVLASGDRQISWKALRAYLGERRLTTATPEEVLRVTGYEIGAVTPFGLRTIVRVLADEAVFIHPVISLGSGRKGYALILESNLIKAMIPDLEIAPLAG